MPKKRTSEGRLMRSRDCKRSKVTSDLSENSKSINCDESDHEPVYDLDESDLIEISSDDKSEVVIVECANYALFLDLASKGQDFMNDAGNSAGRDIDKSVASVHVSNRSTISISGSDTVSSVKSDSLSGKSSNAKSNRPGIEKIYIVEKILDMRNINGVRQFLLKWDGFPDSENTWEPEENIDSGDIIMEFLAECEKAESFTTDEAHNISWNMANNDVIEERESHEINESDLGSSSKKYDRNVEERKKVADKNDRNFEERKKIGEKNDRNVEERKKVVEKNGRNADEKKRVLEKKYRNVEERNRVGGKNNRNVEEKKRVGERNDRNVEEKKRVGERNDRNVDERKRVGEKNDRNVEERKKVVETNDRKYRDENRNKNRKKKLSKKKKRMPMDLCMTEISKENEIDLTLDDEEITEVKKIINSNIVEVVFERCTVMDKDATVKVLIDVPQTEIVNDKVDLTLDGDERLGNNLYWDDINKGNDKVAKDEHGRNKDVKSREGNLVEMYGNDGLEKKDTQSGGVEKYIKESQKSCRVDKNLEECIEFGGVDKDNEESQKSCRVDKNLEECIEFGGVDKHNEESQKSCRVDKNIEECTKFGKVDMDMHQAGIKNFENSGCSDEELNTGSRQNSKMKYFPGNMPMELQEIFQVEKILRMRWSNGARYFFLKWEGFPESENSWEPEGNLECPDLIEDFLANIRKPKVTNPEIKKTEVKVVTEKSIEKKGKKAVTLDRLSNDEPILAPAVSRQRGFEKGRVAEVILGSGIIDDELNFLIKWENMDMAHLVPARRANIECPQIVIKFYEQNVSWQNENGSITKIPDAKITSEEYNEEQIVQGGANRIKKNEVEKSMSVCNSLLSSVSLPPPPSVTVGPIKKKRVRKAKVGGGTGQGLNKNVGPGGAGQGRGRKLGAGQGVSLRKVGPGIGGQGLTPRKVGPGVTQARKLTSGASKMLNMINNFQARNSAPVSAVLPVTPMRPECMPASAMSVNCSGYESRDIPIELSPLLDTVLPEPLIRTTPPSHSLSLPPPIYGMTRTPHWPMVRSAQLSSPMSNMINPPRQNHSSILAGPRSYQQMMMNNHTHQPQNQYLAKVNPQGRTTQKCPIQRQNPIDQTLRGQDSLSRSLSASSLQLQQSPQQQSFYLQPGHYFPPQSQILSSQSPSVILYQNQFVQQPHTTLQQSPIPYQYVVNNNNTNNNNNILYQSLTNHNASYLLPTNQNNQIYYTQSPITNNAPLPSTLIMPHAQDFLVSGSTQYNPMPLMFDSQSQIEAPNNTTMLRNTHMNLGGFL